MSRPGRAVAFLDRDGTLIEEPEDEQVDRLDKLALVPQVIPSLLALRELGYRFVVVTNQDGLGTPGYPRQAWETVQRAFVSLFASQGIVFDDVLVCPHRADEGCTCRKPHLGLLRGYLEAGALDRQRSCVVGDRESDLALAANLGLLGLRLARNGRREGAPAGTLGWPDVVAQLAGTLRTGAFERRTAETVVSVAVTLDRGGEARVATGIGMLDHMLEQLARHGGFDLVLSVEGDLHVDEHHTVEDTAIALGTALSRALGERAGIGRYGFSLPMDESAASALVDLSGRGLLRFEGLFPRPSVGQLSTEMVPHFFRSLAEALGMTLHLEVRGENAHHMVEACFKAVARALRPALARGPRGPGGTGGGVPSTKGIL